MSFGTAGTEINQICFFLKTGARNWNLSIIVMRKIGSGFSGASFLMSKYIRLFLPIFFIKVLRIKIFL